MIRRRLILAVLLLAFAASGRTAAQDAAGNLGVVIVSTGYDDVATSIVLTTGHGARLPTAPYNCAWYNATDYPGGLNSSATIDPNYEIVRVTSRSTDTLTVTRAQESTSASTKNTGGKTYVMQCGLTAARFTSINDAVASSFVTIGAASGLASERALTGTSNQITVTDGGAGSTVTLSTPQNLHTAATWQAATLGLGNAIQRGGLFEIKEATAASLTGGGAYAAISSAAGATALAIIDTTFSTHLGNALTLAQSAAGYVTIGNGLGTLATANKGNSIELSHAGRQVIVKPGTSTGLFTFGLDYISHASSGVGYNQSALTSWARVDSGNGYYNPVFRFGHTNGTNYPYTYEIGAEGFDTDADSGYGGTFGPRWYVWDAIDAKNLLIHDRTDDPETLFVGGETATPGGYSLTVHGRYVTTEADGKHSGGLFGGFFSKNDANTRTFPVVQIKPTFTFGGSNTTTTVNVLDVDTVNTTTTGTTINLINARYGGAARFSVSSAGAAVLAGSITAVGADLGTDAIQSAEIAADQVTYAKIQNAAANTVLANATGSSGDVGEVALSASTLLGRGSTGNVAALTVGKGLSISGTVVQGMEQSKTFTIESPGAAENFGGIRFNQASTITKVVAVLQGSSTPSVTWQVRHGSDRSAAGTDLFTANKTTTSTTTGAVETATFNDASIAADHFVWFVTTAQSGTVTAIHVTIFYTVD